VCGGGHAALMLAEAPVRWSGAAVQPPKGRIPAIPPGHQQVLPPPMTPEGTRTLAARSVAIIFEEMMLDLDLLAPLEAECGRLVPRLRPSGRWSRSVSKTAVADRLQPAVAPLNSP